MKKFIEMKIENVEEVLKEMKAQRPNCLTEYECGKNDGYVEAAELELQTLNQILIKIEND